MQSVRSAPRVSSSCRYSERQLRTRAIGTGRSRRRSSTPSPSRVIVSRRVTSSSRSPSTSATRSRVEFVPRSTAATRVIGSAGRRGASAFGAELPPASRGAPEVARARCGGARWPPGGPWLALSASASSCSARAAALLEPGELTRDRATRPFGPSPELDAPDDDDGHAGQDEREADEERRQDHARSLRDPASASRRRRGRPRA